MCHKFCYVSIETQTSWLFVAKILSRERKAPISCSTVKNVIPMYNDSTVSSSRTVCIMLRGRRSYRWRTNFMCSKNKCSSGNATVDVATNDFLLRGGLVICADCCVHGVYQHHVRPLSCSVLLPSQRLPDPYALIHSWMQSIFLSLLSALFYVICTKVCAQWYVSLNKT